MKKMIAILSTGLLALTAACQEQILNADGSTPPPCHGKLFPVGAGEVGLLYQPHFNLVDSQRTQPDGTSKPVKVYVDAPPDVLKSGDAGEALCIPDALWDQKTVIPRFNSAQVPLGTPQTLAGAVRVVTAPARGPVETGMDLKSHTDYADAAQGLLVTADVQFDWVYQHKWFEQELRKNPAKAADSINWMTTPGQQIPEYGTIVSHATGQAMAKLSAAVGQLPGEADAVWTRRALHEFGRRLDAFIATEGWPVRGWKFVDPSYVRYHVEPRMVRHEFEQHLRPLESSLNTLNTALELEDDAGIGEQEAVAPVPSACVGESIDDFRSDSVTLVIQPAPGMQLDDVDPNGHSISIQFKRNGRILQSSRTSERLCVPRTAVSVVLPSTVELTSTKVDIAAPSGVHLPLIVTAKFGFSQEWLSRYLADSTRYIAIDDPSRALEAYVHELSDIVDTEVARIARVSVPKMPAESNSAGAERVLQVMQQRFADVIKAEQLPVQSWHVGTPR